MLELLLFADTQNSITNYKYFIKSKLNVVLYLKIHSADCFYKHMGLDRRNSVQWPVKCIHTDQSGRLMMGCSCFDIRQLLACYL